MICMDREFCESARTLSLKGAEIVIVPNACPLATCDVLGDARLSGLRALAYENLLGVATTNYPKPSYDGHSCAFDNLGKPLVMANDEEQILIAEFNITSLRKVRSEEWECRGSSARKPEAYEM
jgi:predicted amidohydrolase